MKKRPSIVLLTALLAVVFAAGIGVYSSYIGMKIYQESSNNLFESFSQISKTFTLFVQRNWTVLGQWDGLLKNTGSDADAENIWPDVQGSKESWRYSDFYLLNEDSQYLTADGRKGSAGSISGVIQELYREDGPIVSTYTASYGVPKIVFAMPLSRNITLDGVTYTGLAVSYDTDVVDDLVDGSMYSGQSDCYIVRTNGDIVLALEPQTELCKGLTNLYDIDTHAEWKYGTMDDIMKTTGRRKRHEKQDPAPRRGDARPAADRGDGAAARRRTASARAGRGVRCPQHRLVPADGRRAARCHAPGHAPG